MASITFQNVTKRFGDTLAVDDANFEIQDNSFFCLFGPPLSGKSTILKLILGLEKPDEGEILIDGKPVNQVDPASRNVAMVFQNLALFPHMSARDNVSFPLVERKVDKQEMDRKVMEVAEKLHMTHILQKLPAQLSGGERQRVAIARALVRDPVAYLMDDPISALDARLREETRIELRRIQQELGKTLVYVTHDQEEAMSVAEQMAVLRDGRICQIDAPQQLYENPNSTYVASMLGAPAMNVVPLEQTEALRMPSAPDGAKQLGVRPENLRVTEGDSATIKEVEPLGGTTTLYLDCGAVSLTATMRGQPKFEAGRKIGLAVEQGKAHFFDAVGNAVGATG